MKVVKELPFSIYHSIRLSMASANTLRGKNKEVIPAIVSLTSIPSRLSTLHLVIRSLLDQDHAPKKIVLWLNDDLKNNLPKKLSSLESDLFTIQYSELTCSHRKLIHSLAAYPDDIIITCDDDLIYRKEWLSKIYGEHQRNPKAIIGNHTVHINHNENGQPLPFKQWRYPKKELINPNAITPIGAWGILYPPKSLSEKTTDASLFLKLTPKADDLWFKAMGVLQGTLSVQAKDLPREPIPIIGTQKVALKKVNLSQDKNTEQWNSVSDYFSLNTLILKSLKVSDLTTEINNCIKVLSEGGLILYPTDTVWGIGCDATNEQAVKKVYALKKRVESKALICLVANYIMLEKHVATVPEVAYDLIDLSEKPVTIIFDKPQGIAKNLIAEDNSLAIRIASDKFCQYLINKFKKPIVSTSANISGTPTPLRFGEIDDQILKGVDYTVALYRDKINGAPSSIIKLGNDATVKIIRA